ncbi:MAG: hypothetical protein ABFR75_06485 [Acidobacteriota bacterium]
MKKILQKAAVLFAILILIFVPFLLIIDFDRYLPVVLFVWVISVAYFIFIKKK